MESIFEMFSSRNVFDIFLKWKDLNLFLKTFFLMCISKYAFSYFLDLSLYFKIYFGNAFIFFEKSILKKKMYISKNSFFIFYKIK